MVRMSACTKHVSETIQKISSRHTSKRCRDLHAASAPMAYKLCILLESRLLIILEGFALHYSATRLATRF